MEVDKESNKLQIIRIAGYNICGLQFFPTMKGENKMNGLSKMDIAKRNILMVCFSFVHSFAGVVLMSKMCSVRIGRENAPLLVALTIVFTTVVFMLVRGVGYDRVIGFLFNEEDYEEEEEDYE